MSDMETGAPPGTPAGTAAGTAPRIADLDALRAFALFGILCVNIWYFADPYAVTGSSSPVFQSGVDTAVRFAVSLLFEAKFYILFSFLFGYSFVLQWASAVSGQESVVARTVRRAAGLVVLGLLHGLLLFNGDILLTYGLLGLVLLGTRHLSPRAAAMVGISVIGCMGVLIMLLGLVSAALEPLSGETAGTTAPAMGFAGPPADVLAQNVTLYPLVLPNALLLQGPIALGAFYLGMACAKGRIFENGIRQGVLRRLVLIALPAGLAASVLQACLQHYLGGPAMTVLAFGISTLTAPLLTAGYVGALLLFFPTPAGQRLRSILSPAGRLALTNYLSQSVLLVLVFTGYGLALTNRLAPLAVVGVAVALFGAQLFASYWWTARFRYGPMEWLLRALTYWNRPAMLR